MWLKQNCVHLDENEYYGKYICRMEHDYKEVFTTHPATRKKHYYYPCKAKYCPDLGACKKEI